LIDNIVARWVNKNFVEHSRNRVVQLTRFNLRYTSLRDNDYLNYLGWVCWCREMAEILSEETDFKWRARDVEMAMFTAERNNLELNVIP